MFTPKNPEVMERQLVVQRLSIPFKITSNATPSSKSLSSDDGQILQLQTLGQSQIPAPTTTPPGTLALATAAGYGVLAASAITTSSASVVNGNLGEYPGSTVTGAFTVTGSTNLGNADALQAKNDAQAAYTSLAGHSGYSTIPNALDGQSLTAGYYTFAAGDVNLAQSGNGTLTLTGSSTDIFVFKTPSTLTTGAGGIPTITLAGGALSSNVFWLIGSSATINVGVTSANATFRGTIIATTSITATQISVIDGRVLALGGAVTFSASAGTTAPTTGSTFFDLSPSDVTGAFNMIINIAPGEMTPNILLYNGDRFVKFMSAVIVSRTGGGSYKCYPNQVLPMFDPTLTQIYLNCPSAVNFTTTSLDACLDIDYTTFE
jgi:hypothetical protein